MSEAMKQHPFIKLIALLSMTTLWVGCGTPSVNETPETPDETTPEAVTEKLEITVSILPQKYFVERIGGNTVDVNVMVQPGASPATYEPKPQQMKALSDAEAYLRMRVPFEKAWMDRIESANSEMKIVDLTQGIDRQPIAQHHHHGEHDHAHHHGEEEEKAVNLDPHIWLSPALVKQQAQTIYNTLVALNPDAANTYQENLDALISDIETLDQNIEATLADLDQRTFMVFHPSWGYFARDYDLEMIPIEVGGTEPSAAELSQFVKQAKAEKISVIFVQPQFGVQSANAIAQSVNAEVLEIDPLAENWLENMQSVTDVFETALNQTPDQQ
ncbi:periplasmic solute binding protein [Halothece sp. PCC 7418]|uniref:metal ABC transporter solute-binding protein, Zn/Mn family n=1 Tax=Halothece sp. (strain PCC 7418) TaxID=65093 RepID=UPI0002A086E9|nr:zinc ABC transporter substrate-binding protein [Halothece sp. PCC 7418]AFZ42756.1 periplasmic solute binding protein [Halothece sp. PCC 7418]